MVISSSAFKTDAVYRLKTLELILDKCPDMPDVDVDANLSPWFKVTAKLRHVLQDGEPDLPGLIKGVPEQLERVLQALVAKLESATRFQVTAELIEYAQKLSHLEAELHEARTTLEQDKAILQAQTELITPTDDFNKTIVLSNFKSKRHLSRQDTD